MLDSVLKFLNTAESQFVSISAQKNDWADRDTVLGTLNSLKEALPERYLTVNKAMQYIFTPDLSVDENTRNSVDLIQKWHAAEEDSCVAAILCSAMTQFDFRVGEDDDLIRGILFSSILAEVPNALLYHNNLHFRKVVLHVVRMIVAHNAMFEGTNHSLDKSQVTALLIAAAIHDLGHQGKGNITNRKYEMAKTEKRSFELAAPYLREAGISEELLCDIRTMLIGTDVSPFGDPISPANQVRAAYEYHYGTAEDDEALELCEDLIVLESNADLCMMCLMLHEADIMNSAGLSYEITCQESIFVSKEIGRPHASPEDTLLFLEKICCGEMLSDSARFLASDNLQKILTRVMQDFKDGNVSYF